MLICGFSFMVVGVAGVVSFVTATSEVGEPSKPQTATRKANKKGDQRLVAFFVASG